MPINSEDSSFLSAGNYEERLLSLRESLTDVDTSEVSFSDYFDETDLINNVLTLLRLIKIRTEALENKEDINPQFDILIKLLLSDQKVTQSFEKFMSKSDAESEIINSVFYERYQELEKLIHRFENLYNLFTLMANKGYKEKGVKFRNIIDNYTDEEIEQLLNKQILNKQSANKSNISEQDLELLRGTYLPLIQKYISDLKKQLQATLNPQEQSISFNEEICKVLARIQYEKLLRYKSEFDSNGFVWTDYMKKILDEVMETISQGFVPSIVGESGVGKSIFAKEAAVRITGYEPVTIPCHANMSSKFLFSGLRKFVSDQSYQEYGGIVQAYTGYLTSMDKEPAFNSGRFARLEEFNFAGKDIYSAFKFLFDKKPGDLLEDRKILEGSGLICTSNPPGTRYFGRVDFDPAFKRHFKEIEVDYMPQTELYDFMIACLMDKNGLIKASYEEVAPNYTTFEYIDPHTGKNYETSQLSNIETSHGYLFRMSLAFKLIQDAYKQYNSDSFVEGNLRFQKGNRPNYPDEILIVSSSETGEPLKIIEEVLTPADIKDILSRFKGGSFTDSMIDSLKKYLNEDVKLEEDKEIIEAIFNHYGLFNQSMLNTKSFCTKEDIGFLSPSVPRPVRETKIELESSSKQTKYKRLLTETGKLYRYFDREQVFEDELLSRTLTLHPGESFFVRIEDRVKSTENILYLKYLGVTTNEKGDSIILFRKNSTDIIDIIEFPLDEFKSNISKLIVEVSFNDPSFIEKIRFQYEQNKLHLKDYLGTTEFVSFESLHAFLQEKYKEYSDVIDAGWDNLIIVPDPVYRKSFKIYLGPSPDRISPKIMETKRLKFFTSIKPNLNEILASSFGEFQNKIIGYKFTLGGDFSFEVIKYYISTYLEQSEKYMDIVNKPFLFFKDTNGSLTDCFAKSISDNPCTLNDLGNPDKFYYYPFLYLGALTNESKSND